MEEGRGKMEEKKCREGDTSRGQGFLFWKKGSQVAPSGRNLTYIGYFQFDTRIGHVPFTATFVNPADPNYPLIFNGTGEPVGYRLFLPLVAK